MKKVVENYRDANYWYIKYDDGFIIQGGRIAQTFNTDSTWNLTFPKAFTAAPLSVIATFIAPRSSDSSGNEVGVKTNSVTATGLTFINDGYGSNKTGYMWEARGY